MAKCEDCGYPGEPGTTCRECGRGYVTPDNSCEECGHREFTLLRADETIQQWIVAEQQWGIPCGVDTPVYEIRCVRCGTLQDSEEFE